MIPLITFMWVIAGIILTFVIITTLRHFDDED